MPGRAEPLRQRAELGQDRFEALGDHQRSDGVRERRRTRRAGLTPAPLPATGAEPRRRLVPGATLGRAPRAWYWMPSSDASAAAVESASACEVVAALEQRADGPAGTSASSRR